MCSFWEIPFIVVDVETTGSNPVDNRLTEIAAVVMEGGEIVDEFSSLVNPHQFIPTFIANMTGISNEMAALAPEADEILPSIQKYLQIPNAVFVAHNVSFDWNFVKESLTRAGLKTPNIPRICTLKLSRRVLSGKVKKNVGNLANYFSINLSDRHRAYGDARATAGILIELLERIEQEHDISTLDQLIKFQNRPAKNFKLPYRSFKKIEPQLRKLPETPGVYYFKDKRDNLLYVGKAKRLKRRVRSYFNQSSLSSGKISDLVKKVSRVEWTETGTELSALLLESSEIKKFRPPYNTMEKHYKRYPFLKLTTYEKYPVLELCREPQADGAEYFGPFRSNRLVRSILDIISAKFKLRKCSEFKINKKPCLYFRIDKCYSPCTIDSTINQYSEEILKVKQFLSGIGDNLVSEFEDRMNEASESLDFEKAVEYRDQYFELRRILKRKINISSSINDNNIIIAIPSEDTKLTIDIFFIRSGRLARQMTIGRKSLPDNLFEYVHNIYFNGNNSPLFFSQKEIDELRIISSWIYRQYDKGKFIYVSGYDEKEIFKKIKNAIINA